MRIKTITIVRRQLIWSRLCELAIHIDEPSIGYRIVVVICFHKVRAGSALWQMYQRSTNPVPSPIHS